MPKPIEVIKYYKENGWELRCRYCGSPDDLTKDHIVPKSRVPQNVRLNRWKNRFRNKNEYYGQFALVCKVCNQMKNHMTHDEFIEHVVKIVESI